MAPGDVYVVRSGPDLERLTVYPPDPAWRNGRRHLIVYLGEICKQDGVDHLVRAVKLLRDELGRDDIHCVLVGGGPHQPSIKAYAEEIGVAELCTFTGRVSDDDLCRILSSADLGVDPDPKNDWSDKSTMNKIMEYMFFGLPVVAYDLTEHRVSAGPAALFADPNREPTWPAASSSCWTTRPPPARWAGSARSGCARSWPGSTRPRCCWPPTTGPRPRTAPPVTRPELARAHRAGESGGYRRETNGGRPGPGPGPLPGPRAGRGAPGAQAQPHLLGNSHKPHWPPAGAHPPPTNRPPARALPSLLFSPRAPRPAGGKEAMP